MKRERNTKALDILRKYDAASRTRRTSGWKTSASSGNAEIRPVVQILRDRARDLYRNNPYAHKAVNAIVLNTVHTGIKISINGAKNQEEKLKNKWNAWCRNCDADGVNNFIGLQGLVLRTAVLGGDALVRFVRDKNNSIAPVKLQVLEGDYLISNKDGHVLSNGNTIIQGIEFDKQGRRVAYWLWSTHPGDGKMSEEIRVPAEDIIHFFRQERPGQVRGVPVGVSAFIRLRDLGEYQDAQLIRQKIASCFAAFVSGDNGSTIGAGTTVEPLEKLEPGVIEYLPDGKTVTFASPPGVDGYGEYTSAILREVASGYEVSYEVLTGDLSKVNFSSARMGWLDFQRSINHWQQLMINSFCERVWDYFVFAMEMASGKKASDVNVSWTAPRREMIQPKEEIGALKDMVRNGFNSRQDVIRQLGNDVDVVYEELKKDSELMKAAGLALDSDPNSDSNRVDRGQLTVDSKK